MGTYVDDCEMDAKAALRKMLWRTIRIFFDAGDPTTTQKYLGMCRFRVEGIPGLKYGSKISQEEHLQKFLDELPKEYFPKRKITKTGLAGPTPSTKGTEKEPCSREDRSAFGTLIHSAKCTRMDLAHPTSRIGGFLDKWDKWAKDELRHVIGYAATTKEYALHFLNFGDAWEDLELIGYADANLEFPRSESGKLIVPAGRRGSIYALEWQAKRQASPATSTGDSEAISWGSTHKALIRVKQMCDFTRIHDTSVSGRTDNEAVRLAVARGCSIKLCHLRKTAGVNFSFMKATGIPLERIDTTKSHADLFTKVLSAQGIQFLLSAFYHLQIVRTSPEAALDVKVYRHDEGICEGATDLGVFDAFSCTCRCAKLLAVAVLAQQIIGAKGAGEGEEVGNSSGGGIASLLGAMALARRRPRDAGTKTDRRGVAWPQKFEKKRNWSTVTTVFKRCPRSLGRRRRQRKSQVKLKKETVSARFSWEITRKSTIEVTSAERSSR